jgi:hypothetical protein
MQLPLDRHIQACCASQRAERQLMANFVEKVGATLAAMALDLV